MKIWLKVMLIMVLVLVSLAGGQAYAKVYSSISGRVVAEDTGKGIANVIVGANAVVNFEWRYKTVTDSNGYYILKNVAPRDYRLSFGNEDSDYISAHKALRITVAGKNLVNVNYSLKRGHSISGTVYDSDGTTPLNRISVDARSTEPQVSGTGFESAWTDTSGNFVIKRLPFSKTYTVTAEVYGYAFMKKTIDLEKDKGQRIVFVLNRSDITGVSGYVRSSVDGLPLNDGDVYLRDNSGEDIGFVRTDETGKYSFAGVPPGIYKIHVTFGTYSMKKTNISVQSGVSTTVNFDFDKPSSEVLK